MNLKETVARELEAVRARSLALLEPVSEDDLRRQHDPIMSPLLWDLAHIGNYEDLWLLRALGREGVGERYDSMYDAFKNPRPDRPSLPLLSPPAARSYLAQVRGQALDVLERADVQARPDPAGALLSDAFVYGMVVQHEHQHDETMLATLQLMGGEGYRPLASPPPAGAPVPDDEVLVESGPFPMGTDSEPWAYDNERPRHEVDLPAFRIDTTPATNRQWLAFIEAGGYDESRWWSTEGWRWRLDAGAGHPRHWRPEGGSAWSQIRFGWAKDVPLDQPVQHVCWYEADAYARWRGKRLPTEAEWEKAASWDPISGGKGRFPWGDDPPTPERANLGQTHFGPAGVGAYPEGASPWGCLQMVGDVWEWTASDFRAYPGFRSFPYAEYSEVFFSDRYKVLRGGSWATHPSAVRTTFRNWDLPVRRQIFSGVRCARDA